MKREFTCIICPNGCEITAWIKEQGEIEAIEGHTCQKGEEYVRQELTHPMRTIATSVRVLGGELPLVSVRLDAPVPRERIFAVMDEIKKITVSAPVVIGQIIIENVLGTGANVIATKNIRMQKANG